MKAQAYLCLALLILGFIVIDPVMAEEEDDGFTITQNIKTSKRRTGSDVLKDIQSDPDGIANVVVFMKDDKDNSISQKNNKEELALYEKFFDQLDEGWEGCDVASDIMVDVVEVSEPLSIELNTKITIHDDEFKIRTMVMPLMDGHGYKI